MCDVCGSRLATAHSLTSHKRQQHSESVKCEYCDKICGSQKRMKEHVVAVHLSTKNVPCTKCDISNDRLRKSCTTSSESNASSLYS